MEHQGLEQAVELEYVHFNPNRRQPQEVIDSYITGEMVAELGHTKIVYFWRINSYGELQGVIVPGIVIKERHRRDENGNEYSLVKPVEQALRPGFEGLVWLRLMSFSGIFIPGPIKFDYWSESDSAQRKSC